MRKERAYATQKQHVCLFCAAFVLSLCFLNVLFARCLRHCLCQAQKKALSLQNKTLRVGLHKLGAYVAHRPYDSVEIHLFGHITQVYVLHALHMRLVYVAHVFGIRRTRGWYMLHMRFTYVKHIFS